MMITIMLKERYETNDDIVLRQLRQAGFHLDHALPTIGALVGEADENKLDDIESLPCVGWVEHAVA